MNNEITKAMQLQNMQKFWHQNSNHRQVTIFLTTSIAIYRSLESWAVCAYLAGLKIGISVKIKDINKLFYYKCNNFFIKDDISVCSVLKFECITFKSIRY